MSAGLSLAACQRPQEPMTPIGAEAAHSPQEPIVIELERYAGRLRQARVTIGGETHPFLLDTGGGVTVVGPRVAALIGCTPYGQMTAFRMHGERLDMKKCQSAKLQIGEFATESDLVFLDLMSLLPEGLPPIEGLISLDTFKDQAITLDLSKNQLTVESEQSLRKRTEDMQEMRVAFDRGVDNNILDAYVEAPTLQGSLWLVLDSGNLSGFILNPQALKQLGFEAEANEGSEDNPKEIGFEIAGLGVVQTPVLVQNVALDGAVSAQFMEQLVLTLDLRTKRLWGRFSRPD